MLVLITYDVNTADPAGRTRLRRIAKQCVNYGQRVQNSVFECLLDASQCRSLQNTLCKLIDPEKDADGLHPVNLGKLVLNEPAPLPCTPNGCIHLLRRFGVELNGAKVVVIGRGVTVGRPIGLMLTRRSENSTVTLCHTGTKDLAAETRQADVIIAAAGVAHMLTADMVKPGAAVLDVGVSRVDGKLAGDVADDVWDIAGYVSPNPGGVGPLTRAFLVRNVVERAEKLAGLA